MIAVDVIDVINASTSFMDLIDAVGNYYGVGSDQWAEIAKYGITAENADSILRQTAYVDTVVSKDGKVLSYSVRKPINYTGQPVSGVIDSNAQLPATVDQMIAKYPSEWSIDAQTGNVSISSGMKSVATGQKVATVMGKVATAVGGVMAGCQLGAQCDAIAYQTAPDLWDEMGMSAVNPETWDSICTTDLGKDIFNIVFGIDKDSHVLQAYMDRRAVAQVAQYMQSIGAFSTGERSADIDDHTIIPVSYRNYMNFPVILDGVISCNRMSPYTSVVEPYYCKTEIRNATSPVYKTAIATYYDNTETQMNYVFTLLCSKQPFECRMLDTWETRPLSGSWASSESVTVNGERFYIRWNESNWHNLYNSATDFENTGNYFDYGISVNTAETAMNYYAYIILFGSITESGGIDGISKQDDATFPTGITPSMTTDQVIGALATQYPDMIQGALSNDVVQPDGSIDTIVYWPVGMPDNIPIDQITGQLQPIGGVNALQDNSTVTPTKPDEYLDTVIGTIVSPNPQNPNDRIERTYPDVGDGDTPPVVIPTGSVDALYSIYNPTQAQVNSFGAWLWSPDFVDQLKKLFNDPMQSIIGLHKVFATPATSGTGTIHVGYLDSQVGSKLVSDQYTEVDCGSISLYEYFGNALDYLNTDIYLYLPFVGIVPLNVDDVMRATIGVKYKVDVLTGACLAVVNVSRDGGGGQLYTYSGNCAVQYPLSSGSYMGIVASIAGIAGAVVGTIATGGAMLPVAIGAGASALSGAKTKVEHSGSLSGNAGAMGIKKPYLIIRRPQTAIADNFDVFKGVSNNEFVSLGSCSGYTQIRYVNLENFAGATKEEIYEIENLLESGIII